LLTGRGGVPQPQGCFLHERMKSKRQSRRFRIRMNRAEPLGKASRVVVCPDALARLARIARGGL